MSQHGGDFRQLDAARLRARHKQQDRRIIWVTIIALVAGWAALALYLWT